MLPEQACGKYLISTKEDMVAHGQSFNVFPFHLVSCSSILSMAQDQSCPFKWVFLGQSLYWRRATGAIQISRSFYVILCPRLLDSLNKVSFRGQSKDGLYEVKNVNAYSNRLAISQIDSDKNSAIVLPRIYAQPYYLTYIYVAQILHC